MNPLPRTTYTLEENYAPIIKGEVPLPNAEDVDPLSFLNDLAAVGHGWTPKWGWTLIEGRKVWTYFFLTSAGMGGGLDGGGYAVSYRPSYKATAPKVQRFAICKHEKVDAPGANHSRGWHPGSCKHCGLDMTVDSGD